MKWIPDRSKSKLCYRIFMTALLIKLKSGESLAKGQPNRMKIATTILENRIKEMI